MKKLAISLCFILAVTGTSMAFYEGEEMHEIDTLRAQGYSESTIQIVDTTTRYNKGKNAQNSRIYTRKRGKNPLGRSYTAIKNYFDPLQDDALFGEHQINFTNTWNGDLPWYAQKYNTDYKKENL